ncbi:PAS domain S-box-containing protein [Methanomicrobium sp. W14]|uniref:PAS domain-containing protein n=1 Tax=Methanomicrobium sp. W14 TaxID=2817839 RepID=UPI001AE6CAF4|nr:PAS domain-containing protein [Methanomicrobium sp. W14]MBP2133778.1 PAS domain S-box-containing protein [Methanomicrobium sp. W14]
MSGTAKKTEIASEILCKMLASHAVIPQGEAEAGEPEECPFAEQLMEIFVLSPEKVFFVSSPSKEIVYVNPAMEKWLSSYGLKALNSRISDIFSPGELYKFCLKDITVPEDCSAGKKISVLLKTEGIQKAELTAVDISGGKYSLILVYAKEISGTRTNKRALRESEVQCSSAINAIRDGVVVVDSDMNITMCNKAFSSVVSSGSLSGEVLGKKLGEVAGFLTGKLGLEYKFVFTSGESLDNTVKYRHEGGLTYYEVIKSPVFGNDHVVQVVTILRDRTQNYNLEELKKEAFFQIEKNMEQFAILNDHIRNPLQAIVGLADLYGGDMGSKIISQAHEINDIVTRLDTGWIESEKVRDMLSKHYGITLKRRPNVESPIGMLKTNEVY